MSYIDEVATEIRARVPRQLLPDGDTTLLFRLYAVLLMGKGAEVTAADVHNAWSVWIQADQPDHESLRPYEELDAETRASDEPYAEAIREAWRALESSR